MKIHFKIVRDLLEEVRLDLERPHEFAAERVGFLSCRAGNLPDGGMILLAHSYHPVSDEDYLDDPSVGAMMGPGAIRKAMEYAYNNPVGMFHVHMHDHGGVPAFSRIDRSESRKFVPDFWHVRPKMPHGAIVLSRDSAVGRCWIPGSSRTVAIDKITVVGAPIQIIRRDRNA